MLMIEIPLKILEPEMPNPSYYILTWQCLSQTNKKVLYLEPEARSQTKALTQKQCVPDLVVIIKRI